jgi:hypothetical protein
LLTRLPSYKKLSLTGYFGGAIGVIHFFHQHMPLLTGDVYNYDPDANLADSAICLASAMALFTAKALKEIENKLKDIASLQNRSTDK